MRKYYATLGEIPDDAAHEVAKCVKDFTALFLLRPDEKEKTPAVVLGSGVFVKINDEKYILTAAHVWQSIAKLDIVNINIGFGRPMPLPEIPIDALDGCEVPKPQTEQGGLEPDLAIIRIRPDWVGTIEARVVFLNLSSQRQDFLSNDPPIDAGSVGGFFGFASELSSYSEEQLSDRGTAITTDASGRLFFGTIKDWHREAAFDCVDLGIEHAMPGIPGKFNGVSGGGYWQIVMRRDETGALRWNGRKHLRGIAVSQTRTGDYSLIKCHGPRSLFEAAWDAWGLPE